MLVFSRGGGNDSKQEEGDIIANKEMGAGDEDAGDGDAAEQVVGSSSADIFQALSEASIDTEYEFTITDDAVNFMNSHPDFFPGSESNLEAMTEEVDTSVDFPQIAKKQTQYSDRLICVSGFVLDCEEVEDTNITITGIQFQNEEDGYGIWSFNGYSNTGDASIYRVTLVDRELDMEEQWSGMLFDDIPEGMGFYEIEWFDASDVSYLANYGS